MFLQNYLTYIADRNFNKSEKLTSHIQYGKDTPHTRSSRRKPNIDRICHLANPKWPCLKFNDLKALCEEAHFKQHQKWLRETSKNPSVRVEELAVPFPA